MAKQSVYIGIDFGTSKCVVSAYDPASGQASPLRNREGAEETPSVVYIGQGKNDLLVGRSAIDRAESEGNVSLLINVKRNLRAARSKILKDGTEYHPIDIASYVFKKLKVDTEEFHFPGQNITHAVITHPAGFNPLQQDRIKQAAMKAGFSQVELLPEPEAAALAYSRYAPKAESCILLYDFGAGTFDVAVVARNARGTYDQVLEPGGLTDCGGDNLDQELYLYCDKIAQNQLKRSIDLTGNFDMRFLRECRKRKENLSREVREKFSSVLPVRKGEGQIYFNHEITREDFEKCIYNYIKQTVNLTLTKFEEAKQRGHLVNKIVLAGGSSYIPLVSHLLADTIPVQLERQWFQKQGHYAVALGAAYHAHNLWGVTTSVKPLTPVDKNKIQPIPTDTTSGPPKKSIVQTPKPPSVLRPPLSPTGTSSPIAKQETSLINGPGPGTGPVTSNNDISRQYSLSRNNSPTLSERGLAFLFLLIYASVGVELFLNRISFFITVSLPYIGSNITWPVLAVLGFCSLVLFSRSGLSTLFAFLQLFLFGVLAFLLFQNEALITIPSLPLIGSHIPWFVGAGVTFFSLWLFVRKLIPRD